MYYFEGIGISVGISSGYGEAFQMFFFWQNKKIVLP